MEKKRNGLLEVYRLFFCFWVMYHHNFFFVERDYDTFTVANLAVDFFFILSGFFLMRSMRKMKEESVFSGVKKLIFSRAKPVALTVAFIALFNLICSVLFIKENYFYTVFQIFRYWWYLLYLFVAIGAFYIVYRLIKSEKKYVTFLVLTVFAMVAFHYALEERGFFIYEFTFVARTIGCLALGMLISYIPEGKSKRVKLCIWIVSILIVSIAFLAYGKKNYLICLGIIALFAALIHFTSKIPIGGKFYEIIGQLSTRMYLYMSFITMLELMGLSNHRILFMVDLFLSILDLIMTNYRNKYLALKKQQSLRVKE